MQEVLEMNALKDETQPVPVEPPAQILPVCPHCGDDPMKLSTLPQPFPGNMVGAIFYCGNPACRKFFNAQIFGAMPTPTKDPETL